MEILSQDFKEIDFQNLKLEFLGAFELKYPLTCKHIIVDASIMECFRNSVRNNEISERVYRLTHLVLQETPSNLTVWKVRRACIRQLEKCPLEELEYVKQYSEDNPKSYQIYEHRRKMIEMIGKPLEEIEYINYILQKDNKNYHVWLYRKSLCSLFQLYLSELLENDMFIEEDIGNNSAWNYRYFLQENNPSFNIQKELDFTIGKIKEQSGNEASWNYLNGFFQRKDLFAKEQKQQIRKLQQNTYEDFPQIEKLCQEIIQNEEMNKKFALQTLIFISIERKAYDQAREVNNLMKYIKHILQDYDQIRKNYWTLVQQKFT